MKAKKSRNIPSVVFHTTKGLTRMAAYAKLKNKVTDFRGFTYDPKTGRAVFT